MTDGDWAKIGGVLDNEETKENEELPTTNNITEHIFRPVIRKNNKEHFSRDLSIQRILPQEDDRVEQQTIIHKAMPIQITVISVEP